MPAAENFLSDIQPRRWSPDARHGFTPAGLFIGKGANGIEVAVASAAGNPTRIALLEAWKVRRIGRAGPIRQSRLPHVESANFGETALSASLEP